MPKKTEIVLDEFYPEISIIIPIYNAGNYLKDCIKSILEQTFSQFELILVDDGSNHLDKEVCDFYAQRDNRIRVIHKENGGVSSARNIGLKVAKGKYVGFVDADDIVAPSMYETLYHLMIGHNADIAVCKYRRFFDKQSLDKRKENGIITVFDDKEKIMERYLNVRSETENALVTNKLYRREKLKYPFLEGMKAGEDAVFNARISPDIERIVFIKEELYFYRNNSEGVTNNGNEKTDKDNVRKMQILLNLSKEHLKDNRFFVEQINGYLRNLILFYVKGYTEKYSIENYRYLYEEFLKYYKMMKVKKWKISYSLICFLFEKNPDLFSATIGNIKYKIALFKYKIEGKV